MSSMYLLKDHTRQSAGGKEPTKHKKGDVISVPFFEGKAMAEQGIARHWNGGAGAVEDEAPPEARPVPQPKPPAAATETKPPAKSAVAGGAK